CAVGRAGRRGRRARAPRLSGSPPELLPRARAAPRPVGPRLAGPSVHAPAPVPARARARAPRAGARRGQAARLSPSRSVSGLAAPPGKDDRLRALGRPAAPCARPPGDALGALLSPAVALRSRLLLLRELARRRVRIPHVRPHRLLVLPQVRLPLGAPKPVCSRQAISLQSS